MECRAGIFQLRINADGRGLIFCRLVAQAGAMKSKTLQRFFLRGLPTKNALTVW